MHCANWTEFIKCKLQVFSLNLWGWNLVEAFYKQSRGTCWIHWEDLKPARTSQNKTHLGADAPKWIHITKQHFRNNRKFIWKQTLSIHFGDSFEGSTHGTTSVPRLKITPVSGSKERGKKAPKHSPKVIENAAYKWHTMKTLRFHRKKPNTEN